MNKIINWIKTGDTELSWPTDEYERERQLFHRIAIVTTVVLWAATLYVIFKR